MFLIVFFLLEIITSLNMYSAILDGKVSFNCNVAMMLFDMIRLW